MPAVDLAGMGDSLTWGYPFGPEASWLDLAARATGLVVINRGVSGETTAEMKARFGVDVVDCHPRVVIIMGGTNDAWMELAAAEVKDNVQAMVDAACRAGIVPVIALPPPLCPTGPEIPAPFLARMATALQDYREAYGWLASSRGLRLLDFYNPLLDPATGWGKREYFIDDAHPSRQGYQVMAAVAVELFQGI